MYVKVVGNGMRRSNQCQP